MATEQDRITSVRRITNPDDATTYVDSPVIDRITFADPYNYYQETQYTYDNTNQNLSRKTHTFTVKGIADPSSKVDVERIDSFDVVDGDDAFQETLTTLLNNDSTDDPPNPPKHLKTHTIKVYGVDANGVINPSLWIKWQRVDRFSVTDPQNYYQETIYQLIWADGADTSDGGEGNTDLANTENSPYDSNLDAPDTSSDGTAINPPWRVDPFQNIIDVSWNRKCMMVMYDGNKVAAISMTDLKSSDPLTVIYRKVLAQSDWTTGSSYNDNSQQLSQLKFSKNFMPIMASFSIVPNGAKASSIKVVDDCYRCWNTADFLLPGIKSGYINNYYGYSGQNGVPPIINGAANTVYFLGETFTLNPNTKVIEWTAANPDEGIPTFTSSTGDYCWGVDSVTTTDTITTTGGWTQLSSSQNATLQANSPINPNTGVSGGYARWDTHEEYFFAMSSGVEISYATYTEDRVLNTYAGYYVSISGSGSGSEELTVARATMSSVGGYDVVAVAHDAITRSPTFPTINETDLEQNISWQYATTYSGTSSYLYLNASGTTTTITGNDRTKGHVEASIDDPTGGVWVHTGGYSSDTTTAQWRNLFFWPYGTHDKYFVNVTDETSYDSSNDWGSQPISGGSGTFSVTTPWGVTFQEKVFMRGWLHISNGEHILQGILMMSGSGPMMTIDSSTLSKALYLDGADFSSKLTAAIGMPLAKIDAILFDVAISSIQKLV